MTSSNTMPLKIALLGIGERDRAILDLFLRKHCPGDCRVVTEERADLCILDLDGVQGRKLLQHQRDNHPHRPLIVLSVRDTDIDGVQSLRKPLQSELLKRAIDFYRSELAQRTPEPEVVTPTQPQPENNVVANRAPVGFAKNKRGSLHRLEYQNRIAHECCGLASAIDLSKQIDSDKLYYDPNRLFQHILESAIERCRQEAQPIRLHLPGGKHVTLLPKCNVALTDLSDARLRPRCLLAIKQDETRIEYLRSSEAELLRASHYQQQNIDALLWKVTLWSARGRLPVGTDINSIIGLMHWPNLTRLLSIPQFLRVAALWAKNPLTLAKTAEILGIEARYVCAFFSACHALELTSVQSAATNLEVPVVNVPTPSRSGLLGRILRRLRVA